MRQDAGEFEAMQQPGRTPDAVVRVASIEVWRLQMLSRSQAIAEVKTVGAACHTYLLDLVLFDANLPRATPAKRAKPDVASVLIVGVISIYGEPRVVLGAGRAASALENGFSGLDGLLVQIPLPSPSTREIAQAVVRSTRQVPRTRSYLLDGQWRGGSILQPCRSSEDAGGRVCLVLQVNIDFLGDVLKPDDELVALDGVRYILQHEIAIAVRKGDLQIGLNVEASAPSNELLTRGVNGKIE